VILVGLLKVIKSNGQMNHLNVYVIRMVSTLEVVLLGREEFILVVFVTCGVLHKHYENLVIMSVWEGVSI
jgi:hypothetical protein